MVKNGPSTAPAGPDHLGARALARQRVHGRLRPPAVAVAEHPRPLGQRRRRPDVAALAQRDVGERGQQDELQAGPVAGGQVGGGIVAVAYGKLLTV